jgi:hypothetical protein
MSKLRVIIPITIIVMLFILWNISEKLRTCSKYESFGFDWACTGKYMYIFLNIFLYLNWYTCTKSMCNILSIWHNSETSLMLMRQHNNNSVYKHVKAYMIFNVKKIHTYIFWLTISLFIIYYTPYNRLSGQQMLSGTQIISTSHGMTGRNFFDVFLPFYLLFG